MFLLLLSVTFVGKEQKGDKVRSKPVQKTTTIPILYRNGYHSRIFVGWVGASVILLVNHSQHRTTLHKRHLRCNAERHGSLLTDIRIVL